MSKYRSHKTTEPFLKQVRKHKKPYKTRVMGKEIIVYPNVMSPKYDYSSRFHIQNMPNQRGKSFLEIGCGCGVVSLFAHSQGASMIVAVDINLDAVENTKSNFEKHGVRNAQVFKSDVFENVKGSYDTITFVAPYHNNKPKDILEYGVYDYNYHTLRSFVKDAKNYLNPGGQIILGFSDTGDNDTIKRLFIENKLLLKDFKEGKIGSWNAYLYVLEPIRLKNSAQEFIYNNSYFWFKKHKLKTSKGRILQVGSGLGYLHYFIKLYNNDITSLDITRNKESLFPDEIKIYGGRKIPFKDNHFDVVIAPYTLHHEKDYRNLFREIVRVSINDIMIIEEIYSNIISRLYMVFNCWRINRKANQKVNILWDSYLNMKRLMGMIKDSRLKIKRVYTRKRGLFKEVSLVLKKH